jgi:hypothetical protein
MRTAYSDRSALHSSTPIPKLGAGKSLARPGRKQATATEDFYVHISTVFIIITGEILVLFIYATRLASNEILSPSNKIHRVVDRAKDLSAPLYIH